MEWNHTARYDSNGKCVCDYHVYNGNYDGDYYYITEYGSGDYYEVRVNGITVRNNKWIDAILMQKNI